MGFRTEWLRYGPNQQYCGYFAAPDRVQAALPAIVVIQEIWGVDEHIQDVTRRFAQAGYAALAPDLYAVNGERPAALRDEQIQQAKKFLESLPPTAWGNPEEREKALSQLPDAEQTKTRDTLGTLFGGQQYDRYIPHLLSATAFLRSELNLTKGQSVGSVGFCMGGALSALLACHDPELKAAVVFYGQAPDSSLLPGIQCPVFGFYGELDKRITDAVPGFADAMKAAGKSFEYRVFAGAHHAFFNDGRPSYNAAAVREAFALTLSFMQQHLG